ncbi:AF4/FMR2 family member lilli [Drosophila obscura]|uniref:AF4/FMR2 family member lilli n=1 Tax=Drosophila obscura TaxID=7282 RepID=UPI001BB10568|nr:AF4/FMR2 family member lilli [Drosophila obscura]
MFPQAELENYKLQVELLQEKLQRSEDNRQQLEHKLDKILQKRSDLDKSVRHKSRQKYQEFLEEQTLRNERNRKLVHMLERIDEQTVAMSQRSERLKMMKLQYQMYFAKLVQNQTLRCIQQQATQATAPGGSGVGVGVAATGGPIQVLVPPQAAAAASAAGMPAQPMAAAAAAPPQWTLAMATPTHGGMLLTPQFATPNAAAPPGLAAMPVAPQGLYYPELYGAMGASPLGTSNLFDLRATLRAFDNENADLPERMTHFNAATSSQAAAALTGDYQAEASGRATPASAASAGGGAASTTTSISMAGQDKGARQLSSTSSTLATSSLTFDKLPKTSSSMTLTEMAQSQPQPQPHPHPHPLTSAASTAVDDVGGQPQMAAAARGQEMRRSWSREQDHEQEVADMAAWTNSRVTKVEYEKSPTVVGHNEPGQRQPHPQQPQQQQHHNFEAYFGELKIDEPWQPGATPSPSPSQSAADKRQLNVRPGGGANADVGEDMSVGAKVCLTNDLLDEVIASRAALAKAAAAVDEQLARGNQLSPPGGNNEHAATATGPAPAASSLTSSSSSSWNPRPGVSIENIENAIYGERLTGTATVAAAAAASPAAAPTAAPTQGFFENLVTNTSPHELADQQHTLATIEEVQRERERERQPGPEVADYGQYDASSYGEASEPIYASIDSTSQQQQQGAPAEPLYSEIGNPTDYQQYATDASVEAGAGAGAAAETETDAAAAAGGAGGADGAEADAMQQEYSNIDYGNYEAGQYAAGYDPNAYPGYIYDEATGQYIADPNAAQYAPDGSYAGHEYDGSAANYDYASYGEQQQQQQQPQEELQQMQAQAQEQEQGQLEQQEAYPMSSDNGQNGMEMEQSPALAITPAAAIEAKVESTAAISNTTTTIVAASKPVKPTSILSTTDKQAAPNDAQQQQQQQPKKKKRVYFVDSSETDDSSSAKPAPAAALASASGPALSLGPTSGPPPAGAETGAGGFKLDCHVCIKEVGVHGNRHGIRFADA